MPPLTLSASIAVTTAKFTSPTTIDVIVNNGEGGCVELWRQGAIAPTDTKSITTSPSTITFTGASNQNCYYVVAREAFPSTNADIVDVEGGLCTEEIIVEPVFLSRKSSKKKIKVSIRLPLCREQKVHLTTFSKKDDACYFDFAKPVSSIHRITDEKGYLRDLIIGGIPKSHKKAVVIITVIDRKTKKPRRFALRAKKRAEMNPR